MHLKNPQRVSIASETAKLETHSVRPVNPLIDNPSKASNIEASSKSPRTAETALKRRLGREKFSTGSCRRMNTVSNAAGDGNATRNQPGRPERRVVGWRGEHQTPTVSQLKARKKRRLPIVRQPSQYKQIE